MQAVLFPSVVETSFSDVSGSWNNLAILTAEKMFIFTLDAAVAKEEGIVRITGTYGI